MITKAIIKKIIDGLLSEAEGELKSGVKTVIADSYNNHLAVSKETKEIRDLATIYRTREDSLDIHYIDISGIDEHVNEIIIKANSIPVAITAEKRQKAEIELKQIVYSCAKCADFKNDFLDSFIHAVIETVEREYEQRTNETVKYPIATAHNDLVAALKQSEDNISQKINDANKAVIEIFETNSAIDSEQERSQSLIDAFYEEAINRLTSPNYESGELFGYEPLNDVYITPYIMVNGNKTPVLDYIENIFINNNDVKTMILFGEPGQGKTSLCWKAAYEFKKNGWLNKRFRNVLRFSLNATSFNIDDSLPLYDYHLLSTYIKYKGNSLSLDSCKDSLIFLDGFDELYDNVISKPLYNFSMEYFLQHVIFDSMTDYPGCYFVITSRRMCIEKELRGNTTEKSYKIAGINAYGICNMDVSDQDAWISTYEKLLSNNAQNKRNCLEELEIFRAYIEKLKITREDSRIKGLLEIPILFRMVVHCQFLPKISDENYNRADIYEMLFHETIMRHGGDESFARIAMEQLARAIYMDNDDSADFDNASAKVNTIINYEFNGYRELLKKGLLPTWLHSYYTMYSGGRQRIMFLHRSFYQYFLACYIYHFIKGIDEHNFDSTQLVFWGRRRISLEVFDYLKQLFDSNDLQLLNDKGSVILDVLFKTDSILPTGNQLIREYNVSYIDQAGNVFCNLISTLSVLNSLPKEALNRALNVKEFNYIRRPLLGCLKRYSAGKIIIKNAVVNGKEAQSAPIFANSTLTGVDFSNADFKGTDFTGAVLEDVSFKNTKLIGAIFSGTQLQGVDFTNVDLRGAELSNVHFHLCLLEGADFRGASFSNVTFAYNSILIGADFRGASFSNVLFEGSDLEEADFRGALFSDANMADATFKNTNFRGAIMNNAVVSSQIET